MKKVIGVLLFASLLLAQNQCTKCKLNKLEMVCDYYVGKKGDRSKKSFCLEYANYLNDTQVFGKASWYYLLSLKPSLALKTGKEAIKKGEKFAYEYLTYASWILGDRKRAKEYFLKFKESVGDSSFFTSKSLEILTQLYPNISWEGLRKGF